MVWPVLLVLLQGRPDPKVEEKLKAHFHAAHAEFKSLPDGRVKANLKWDFLKEDQLKDFAPVNTEWKDRLTLKGAKDAPAALLLPPLLNGDFTARVEFAFVQDSKQGTGLSLRTNAGDLTSAGEGFGVQLSREKNWGITMQKWGPTSADRLSPTKTVTLGDRITLTLKRTGKKCLGTFGSNVSAEGHYESASSTYLRLSTWDSIQISLFEIEAILDSAWVKEAVGKKSDPPKSGEPLWNGKSLDDWETFRYPAKVENGAVAIDSRSTMPAALQYKKALPLGSSEFEIKIKIEDVAAEPLVGVILDFGKGPQTDGNLSLQFGDVLYLNKFGGAKWSEIQQQKTASHLQKGEYTFVLKIQGRDIEFRAGDSGELKASGVLPSQKEFKIALFLQGVNAKILSVSRR